MWKECKICSSYLVSTEGEVKHKKTNKILKPKIDKDGYLSVGLSMGARGQRKMVMVHRLVAEAFIPNPHNKPLVTHLDGNNANNKYTNLMWVTEQEIILYSKKYGKKQLDQGSTSANAKLTDLQILYCRMVYTPRDSQYGCRALARKFGVSKSTIHCVLHNITYKLPSSQAVRQRALIPRCVGSSPTSATNVKRSGFESRFSRLLPKGGYEAV